MLYVVLVVELLALGVVLVVVVLVVGLLALRVVLGADVSTKNLVRRAASISISAMLYGFIVGRISSHLRPR